MPFDINVYDHQRKLLFRRYLEENKQIVFNKESYEKNNENSKFRT